jgi:predicted ester cyclase
MSCGIVEGRKVEIRMFTVHRISKRRIVEVWFLADWFGVFQQLGFGPETPYFIGVWCRE